MQRQKQLPIFAFKQQILSNIESEKVVIISGKTGCGKSTQVPRYILHEHPQAKIAVCQPRRIAAQSLAARVSQQNGTKLGRQVGYHIGMQFKASDKTRLTYMTYGILIQKLLYDQNIPYTHIILDEIHERSIQMDFTCIALKKILEDNKSSQIKLIIMSATINAKDFSEYFAFNSQNNTFIKPQLTFEQQKKQKRRGRGDRRKEQEAFVSTVKRQFVDKQKFKNAKCIQLKVGTPYKIEELFIEDFSDAQTFYSEGIDTRIDDTTYEVACKIIQQQKTKQTKGDILVFVPGIFQIKRIKAILQNRIPYISQKIIQVHSAFSEDLVHRLFNLNNPNKIILATNMGESSITLPQCKIVIDFCLTRKNYSNKLTGFSRFQTRLASKSSLSQRAGRVGRVSDGVVYRLISKKIYQQLSEFDVPEIKCVSLQMLILKAKQIDLTYKTSIFQDPYDLLLNILDPPQIKQIEYAIDSLLTEDALLYQEPQNKQKALKFVGKQLKMTKIGQFMVSMPCQLRVSKMILLAIKLGIPGTIIDIASQFVCQKDFFAHQQKRDNIEQFLHALVGYDEGNCNDYLLRQRMFNHWRQQFYMNYKYDSLDSLMEKKKRSENNSLNFSKQDCESQKLQNQQKNLLKSQQLSLPNRSKYQQNKQKYKEKSNNFQKDEIPNQKAQRLYQTQNKIISNPSEIQQQINKIVQQFCKRQYSQKQKNWCLMRGVYPTTMRQILRISQNLRARLEKQGIKVPLESQKKINNQLVILCLVFAFKQTDCLIQWTNNQKKQRDDIKNLISFDIPQKYKINQEDLLYFAKPELQPKITFRNKYVEIVGDSSTLKKYLLPAHYSKARQDKCSEVFKCLSKQRVYYAYQPNIENISKKITILNQSVNKQIMNRSHYNQYLITSTIQQSKGNYFVKACALISEVKFYLISILVRKNISLKMHKSKQFYEAVLIDDKQYTRNLPFLIRQQEVEKILTYRNILRRQNSIHIASEQQIMKPSEIQDLLHFFKSVEPKLPIDEWQRYFLDFQDSERQKNRIKMQQNKDDKAIFGIDNLMPLKKLQTDFQKRYKQWKQKYLQQFYYDIRIHTINKPYFICKQCHPNKITRIEQFHYFDFQKKMIDYNQYRMDCCLKQKKLYCLMSHRIGVLMNEDWAQFDQKNVLVYIPFNHVEEFNCSQPGIKQKINDIFSQKKQQYDRKRRRKDYIQCKICLHYDDYDQIKRTCFNRDQLGEKFWPSVQKHILDKKHIARLDKFKVI